MNEWNFKNGIQKFANVWVMTMTNMGKCATFYEGLASEVKSLFYATSLASLDSIIKTGKQHWFLYLFIYACMHLF